MRFIFQVGKQNDGVLAVTMRDFPKGFELKSSLYKPLKERVDGNSFEWSGYAG